MTRSCLATSASRAFSSVTSSEMGCAFWTPAERDLACSRVLQAVQSQRVDDGWPFGLRINTPTVTEMPDSERMSSVGRVTNPAPSINTLLGVQRQYEKMLGIGAAAAHFC